MRTSIFAGETITLVQGVRVGTWRPATRDDAELLGRILRRRQGDPVKHPARDQVHYLVALCASRGVSLMFDPSRPPSPAPAGAAAGRRDGRRHR